MISILGATGWVGQRFCSYFQKCRLPFETISREKVAFSTRSLRLFLEARKPDFVLNAAGFTGKPNVDACESAQAESLEGNAVLPVRVGAVCAELGIPWGHVSSGCIYQGERGTNADGTALGFREEDAPNFDFPSGRCSFYSGTKALAEQLILQNFPSTYVWRLRIPFDHRDGARNYLSKLQRYQRLLDARNSLSHLDDFIAAAWATVERRLPFGVYNLTNPGFVTTREVVDLISREGAVRRSRQDTRTADRFQKKFDFFASEEEFMKCGVIAPRSNCILDTTKAESYKLPMRPVTEALVDSLQRWEWEQA